MVRERRDHLRKELGGRTGAEPENPGVVAASELDLKRPLGEPDREILRSGVEHRPWDASAERQERARPKHVAGEALSAEMLHILAVQTRHVAARAAPPPRLVERLRQLEQQRAVLALAGN